MSQVLLEYDSAIPQKLCEDVVLSFSSQTCQSITCFAIGKNYLTFCSKAFSLCAYFTTCPFIPTKHLGRFQKDSLSGIFQREPDLPLSLTGIVYKATAK